MNEWVSLVQTFGVAVTILLFMGAGSWKVAPWIGSTVIQPIVERYLKLLDALIASVLKQAEVLERLGHTMEAMGKVAGESSGALSRLHQRMSELDCIVRKDSGEEKR